MPLGPPLFALASAALVILDDGEKIARDKTHALPPSPWNGDVSLVAMRGETVAIQAVVESRERLEGIHATASDFVSADGRRIEPRVETWAEHFVEIARPSGNEHEPGSLAFTEDAAPDPKNVTGFWADALVPGDAALDAGDRAAVWIDLTVPADTPPGEYATMLHVSSHKGAIGARKIVLRVLNHTIPWGAQKTMVYYDPKNLERRMGDRAAEIELRQTLHAHHVSAIHDVPDVREMTLDDDALSGELFTPAHGYVGPGEGVGEGIFAIGAYGSLGEPTRDHLEPAVEIIERLRARGRMQDTQIFLYAIDETCDSPWAGQWLDVLARVEAMRGVRVGATCGRDPSEQRADLVMTTARDYVPERARAAKSSGKWVWAYNGQRPWSGPLMLDVPAVDLRANAWIAARYGVERWFYWESTYWLDDNRGGRGGKDGFDPFVVAETFHNADGDWANGDGILLYPGTQMPKGMTDFGLRTVFPSVRLKNLRRGVEDVAYIEAARAIDREAADAIVRRVIPSALGHASRRPSWPERGAAFLEARRELARILEKVRDGVPPPVAPPTGCAGASGWAALFGSVLALLAASLRARRKR